MFGGAKHKLLPRQSLCFIASNMVFHTTKRYLWRSETLPLAILSFVNRTITDEYPCNHLSINALRITSKNGVFSTEWLFRDQHPPFFWLKTWCLFDKSPFCRMRNNKWCLLASDKGSQPLQHNTRSNAHGISSFEYKSFYTLLSWGHAPVIFRKRNWFDL